ncbi:DNA polymerase III subunit alpha [Talaromyces islandicus]|uniref:DNA polymerase III subunit alpha n=1 Tax=Talaromyces islandicus TaxID=28573 RepID=A0A0U1MBI4_TALIS|nr:DNA polymerase III subunit alpha [Talaromyces islandicus]
MRAFDKVNFSNIHIAFTQNAGYFETPTYHSIRRQVGKDLTKRYAPEERSQVLNQDPSVYGRDYIAHTSSADVKNAVTGGEERADLLEYFQSFDQFLVHGLPCRLPSEKEKEALGDPELIRQREQLKKVECSGYSEPIRAMKVKLKTSETSILKKALRRYQEEWVSDYRNTTIMSRGKTRRDTSQKSWLSHTLGKVMPERTRLAKTMPGAAQITHEEKLVVLKDLITYVTRDYSVVYLPNEEPVDDMCPVQGCQQKMTDLNNRAKSKHVHHCRRNEFAQKHRREPSTVHYCYFDCFTWFCDGEEWEKHCSQHLGSLTSLHCEVIMYCNTMIRPAYCPQCLGNTSLKPSERLRKYVRSDDLRDHLEKNHAHDSVCCPSLCGQKFDNDEYRAFHWCDVHGLNSAIWKKMIASQSIKSEKLSIQSTERSQNAVEAEETILGGPSDVTTKTGCWKADDDRDIKGAESIASPNGTLLDMDWEATSPLLRDASSISRQLSPEPIPIDPRILSEQHIEITESAHEDSQKENVTCHQKGQNTVLDIEVPGEQGHNTCDTSTDYPTTCDLLQIPDTCKKPSTKPSKTRLIKNDPPLSEGPMTRAKCRAQSRVTKAPRLRPRRKCRVY